VTASRQSSYSTRTQNLSLFEKTETGFVRCSLFVLAFRNR
jgi:hypothetical protein